MLFVVSFKEMEPKQYVPALPSKKLKSVQWESHCNLKLPESIFTTIIHKEISVHVQQYTLTLDSRKDQNYQEALPAQPSDK